MRKYIIGALVGFCLSLGVGAHAEVSSFVGRVIEGVFPVTYNAVPIGDALVLDGTTYLPVRKLGEALGLTVAFDADLGVSLTKSTTEATYEVPKEVKPVVTTPAKTETVTKKSAWQIESEIEIATLNITTTKMAIGGTKAGDPFLQTLTDRLARYQSELGDLERQKAELQNQK